MPWKLVFYLVILGLILVFVGLNLGNTSDISFGFVSFTDVPVFMSLFTAFFIGVAVALPAAVQSSSRKTRVKTERDIGRKERRAAKAAAKRDRASKKGKKRDSEGNQAYPADGDATSRTRLTSTTHPSDDARNKV